MHLNIYGLLIGIAIYFGISQFQKKDTLISKKKQDKFILLTIFFAIVGARLYHVFDLWDYYSKNPIQIINLPSGGLGILGAIISSFIYITYFCHKNKISLIKLLNQIVPYLALGQSIGRIGNYFNTEVFGKPTYIDIGQYIPFEFRPPLYQQFSYFHPIWLYESILLFFLYLIIRKSKNPLSVYLISYGLIRFFLEFLRFDTWQIGDIKTGQMLSLLMVIIGTILNYLQLKPPMTKKIIAVLSILVLSSCSLNINVNQPQSTPSPTENNQEELEVIPKDTINPEVYPSIEDQLTTYFSDKFRKPKTDATLTISQNTGAHASGGIKFAGEIAGGMWLAHIDSGLWNVDYDGNGTIPCQDVEPFNYPISILSECWDETTSSLKQF